VYKLISKIVGVVALVISMQASHAAVATTTFLVTATVGSSCTATAADLDFGTYDPLSLIPATATTTVTVQCTLLSAYTLGLSAGTGSGATVAVRKMTKVADTLNYSLYQDATHLLVWGETIGTDTVAGVGTGLAIPHIVYGQIPAGQNVNTGIYNDTITVSVNY
jgi:spore coat protein U-like protein